MGHLENDKPKDFRLLSVIPTLQDLYPRPKNPSSLRACKVDEAYDSVDDYLDVQFRVLREDYVSPLRNGLEEFLIDHNDDEVDNSDLRVYKDVHLVVPDTEAGKTCVGSGVKLFFGELKNVDWDDCKLLTPGGLLLLSSDGFKSIIFATVSNTTKLDLRNGFVFVEPSQPVTRDMYMSTYTMLESKNYFEPYRVVLGALQKMNEKNFPMKGYIIEATKTSKLPKYLGNKSLFSETEPAPDWLVAKKEKLDSSQYNAFKHALEEEFAVIQGPPGTGKTFIALEIVEALLKNKELWLPHGPIMVVCYTNHALDQFLEGILKYTSSVIRIGERSKSDKLKPFTLKQQRHLSFKMRNSYDENAFARKSIYEARTNLEYIQNEALDAQQIIEWLSVAEGIVPLECLIMCCSDQALERIGTNQNLVQWLIGEEFNKILYETSCDLPNKLIRLLNEENEAEDEYDFFLGVDRVMDGPSDYKITFVVEDIDARLESVTRNLEMLRDDVKVDKQNGELYVKELLKWELLKSKLLEGRQKLKMKFLKNPLRSLDSDAEQQPDDDDNWNNYWGWIKQSYDLAAGRLTFLNMEFVKKTQDLNESRLMVDLNILKKREIVGLTTTLAARLHTTLQELHAPIVIVEEAAEILESHVVCSMSKDCQHVILIGDHKQLRPKPSDYFVGKDYNLEISLFERMVRIKGSCNQLTRQHRMRPEIANLITPSIYETLENDDSVCDYPNVKGMEKNLYFVKHKHPECSRADEESYSNKHEVNFLIALAKYLVMQGYDPKDITVLSTYLGQMIDLTNERNKYPILKNLNISTVDNYQGEENRIILLSLVRSNGEGRVGFLNEENRVCVALSRAREGLYIIGNIDDLTAKNEIWRKIKKTLEEQNAIGSSISLRCQNHPEELIEAQNEIDFELLCPEGGCLKICNTELECGHRCNQTCHTLDADHKKYKCEQLCNKTCPEGHPCTLLCYEGCKTCHELVTSTLKCGHQVDKFCFINSDDLSCDFKTKVTLPDCKHEVDKPCYVPIERLLCTRRCTKRCENNHQCGMLCYQECGKCRVVMRKELSCGHYVPKVTCSEYANEAVCNRQCNRTLQCGHTCTKKCSEPCNDKCYKKIQKEIPACGHKGWFKCNEEPTIAKCNKACEKKLICGHPCNKKCNEACNTFCELRIKPDSPGLCGHVFAVPHFLRNIAPEHPILAKYCEEPCRSKLDCNHVCKGKCGQCLQGRKHLKCCEILDCGHECSNSPDVRCRSCQNNNSVSSDKDCNASTEEYFIAREENFESDETGLPC